MLLKAIKTYAADFLFIQPTSSKQRQEVYAFTLRAHEAVDKNGRALYLSLSISASRLPASLVPRTRNNEPEVLHFPLNSRNCFRNRREEGLKLWFQLATGEWPWQKIKRRPQRCKPRNHPYDSNGRREEKKEAVRRVGGGGWGGGDAVEGGWGTPPRNFEGGWHVPDA